MKLEKKKPKVTFWKPKPMPLFVKKGLPTLTELKEKKNDDYSICRQR